MTSLCSGRLRGSARLVDGCGGAAGGAGLPGVAAGAGAGDGDGGLGGVRRGAFKCVMTARTPGALRAAVVSMAAMRPDAIVAGTSAACAMSRRLFSDA